MKKIILLMVLVGGQANATGIPTVDVANIVQTTISAFKNIEQVANTYTQIEKQFEQFEKQVEQFENMTGDYFKDRLLNSSSYRNARRWIPENYKDVLDMYRGNHPYQQHQNAAFSGWNAMGDFIVWDIYEYFEDTQSIAAQRWEEKERATQAQIGASEASFQRVSDLIQETERLMDDMRSNGDAKAAMDLNNRMSGQIQLLLAEMVRIQSIEAATQSRLDLYDHTRAGEERRHTKNRTVYSLYQ